MHPTKKETCDSCHHPITSIDFSAHEIDFDDLNSEDFKITSKSYGHCLPMSKCNDCGLIQVNYSLEFEDIVNLYRAVSDDVYLSDAEIRSVSNFQQINQLIESSKINKNDILEIGCGGGHTLSKFSSSFKNIKGIEPSKTLFKAAKEILGGDVENCSFETFVPSKKYDCILAIDVIEHTVSPAAFMRFISDHLKRRGIAIIVTPNSDSIAARILKKRWWHIRPPHLYYFNERSFRILSENNDLTISKSKNFYWRLPLQYLFSALQHLLFKKLLIDIPIKSTVKLNLFDSNIFVVSKK